MSLIFFLLSVLGTYCSADEWLHSAVLDGDGVYKVYWTVDGETITFRTEVRAKGYVGFGLSKHGAMRGSDIVTGWVANGVAHFQDRHGVGNRMPVLDSSQDWHLLEGSENDTHTILKFSRKLITCDKEQDIEIDESTIRLIYAYSEKDPRSPDDLKYHGSHRRGSKSTMLLHPKPVKVHEFSNMAYWEVRSPKFNITPSKRTMYWCSIAKVPKLKEKNHIVRIEPYIQPGSEPFVHHMLMYECLRGRSDRFEPHVESGGHECYSPNMPEAFWECKGVFAVWAVGGQPIEMPDHVGMPLHTEPSSYYMLEIHYDNPSGKGGIIDESGLRFYYTSNLREYDSGTWMIGSSIDSYLVIPPNREKFVVTGHSDPNCLGDVMPEQGVKAFGVMLHSHLLGRSISVRHFRNNTELPPLAINGNYDFNYQEYIYFRNEVTILPNDQITVECTYDSIGKGHTTHGGFSTNEEMCLAFVVYYPRVERFASLSLAYPSLIHGLLGLKTDILNYSEDDFRDTMLNYDWSKINVSIFESATRYSPQSVVCFLGNGKRIENGTSSYPITEVPYKKADEHSSCDQQGTEANQLISKSNGANILSWTSHYFTICTSYLFLVPYLKSFYCFV